MRAMKMGAVDFLEKPFAQGAIAETIQHALEGAREAASPPSLCKLGSHGGPSSDPANIYPVSLH